MTFEEAIEKINDLFFEPCIPGYSTGDFAPEFSGQIEDLEEIIEELQETYAPKIKMTLEQRDELMRFLGEDEEFEDFCYGYRRKLYKEFSEEEELYKEFTESELMRAWLHPELIEVSYDR